MPLTRSQQALGAALREGTFYQYPGQEKARLQSLDLNTYFPLGSILASIPYPDHQHVPSSEPDIFELTHNPSFLLAGSQDLAENLNLLLINHRVRIYIVSQGLSHRAVLRIYVLPDDAARNMLVRDFTKLKTALRYVVAAVDCSLNLWNGNIESAQERRSYVSKIDSSDSLYYLFNNVPSPDPDPQKLKKDANYYAMDNILKRPMTLDLRTEPFEYQQKSAAAMLAREAEPEYHIDPRFERKQNPLGEWFYLDFTVGSVVREPELYENVRGGILAENMGSGKTLISLLLILSTRGHSVRLPTTGFIRNSFQIHKSSPGTRSLKMTAARSIRGFALPYRSALKGEGDALGDYVDSFRDWYDASPSAKRIYLSSTTLVIVPSNLITHWSDEIVKHVQPGTLSVLTFINDDTDLPESDELLKYDVVLLSKARFEDEFDPVKLQKGFNTNRNANQGQPDAGDLSDDDDFVCMCHKKQRACPSHPYTSSLHNMHFLRIIVDEALGFSKGKFSNKASAALDCITAERRWLISGTPSKGLRGVELDIAIQGSQGETDAVFEQERLRDRRTRTNMRTELEQVRQLGFIVTNFFQAQPWSKSVSGQKAKWSHYMIPDQYGKGKAGNLQAVVESLVVRHQVNEVSKEVPLPPLSNRVVYLDACSIDKMSLNLFTVQLVINAVTSERQDQDYMFHPKQKSSLAKLFRNLRHANFYWIGLDPEDLRKALETAERYAVKETTVMTSEDEFLLKEALDMGRKILENPYWQALSLSKEMGLFVKDFPEDILDRWALSPLHHTNPLLMSATAVRKTQEKIEARLYAANPFGAWKPSKNDEEKKKKGDASPAPQKKTDAVRGISLSSYNTKDNPVAKKRRSSTHAGLERPRPPLSEVVPNSGLKSSMKATSSTLPALPGAYSKISKPRLTATSSAKLSYLLDKISEVHEHEKSVIFYEDGNAGFWLAQALEILEIQHEIYAYGIKESVRSQYLHNFENSEETRVLLMDLRLGSHGLHLASVTRVFFVNPVWDETVEAQAIKRAHRTGQTKPVYIETLVLRGTLEDQMLRRRKGMTSHEIQTTARDPTIDLQMHDIIKGASFLSISDEEWANEQLQCAPLKQEYQLYGREFINHPSIEIEQNDAIHHDATSSASNSTTISNGEISLSGTNTTQTSSNSQSPEETPISSYPSQLSSSNGQVDLQLRFIHTNFDKEALSNHFASDQSSSIPTEMPATNSKRTANDTELGQNLQPAKKKKGISWAV